MVLLDEWAPRKKKRAKTSRSHGKGRGRKRGTARPAESPPRRVLSARKCKMAAQQKKEEQRKRRASE